MYFSVLLIAFEALMAPLHLQFPITAKVLCQNLVRRPSEITGVLHGELTAIASVTCHFPIFIPDHCYPLSLDSSRYWAREQTPHKGEYSAHYFFFSRWSAEMSESAVQIHPSETSPLCWSSRLICLLLLSCVLSANSLTHSVPLSSASRLWWLDIKGSKLYPFFDLCFSFGEAFSA